MSILDWWINKDISNLTDEYKAIIASITGVKPSHNIQIAHNEFIRYLKGNNPNERNTWVKFACIIPFFAGMPDSSDALIWWNNPERRGTLSGTPPTYTVNEGFTGNGISAYINTTFNASTDGGSIYTQNNNSSGYWFSNNRTTGSYTSSGVTNGLTQGISIFPLYNNKLYGLVQGGSFNVPNTSTNFLFTFVRSSSSLINGYKDRTILGGDITNSSVALVNLPSYILAKNSNGVTDNYQNDTIGMIFYGSLLDQTDINIIMDAATNLSISLATPSEYSDTCSGTVIDTDKWIVTNPNPDYVLFSQNDGIQVSEVGTTSAGYYTNNITSIYGQRFGSWEFDLISMYPYELASTTSYTAVGLRVDVDNGIIIYSHKSNYGDQYYRFIIRKSGSSVYQIDTGVKTSGKFRIVITPFNEIKLFNYNNDSWNQIGVTQSCILGGDLHFFITGTGNNMGLTAFRNLIIKKYL